VQQLDLDLEPGHAADDCAICASFARATISYVIEHSDNPHSYVPIVDTVNDAKRSTMSSWKIRLPAEGAPVTRLVLPDARAFV